MEFIVIIIYSSNNLYLSEIFYFIIQKTILISAIEKENIELIKVLLSNSNIDPNCKLILNNYGIK